LLSSFVVFFSFCFRSLSFSEFSFFSSFFIFPPLSLYVEREGRENDCLLSHSISSLSHSALKNQRLISNNQHIIHLLGAATFGIKTFTIKIISTMDSVGLITLLL
jgi:hypothetical protein